jgi:toxin ParE1/3/4
VTDFLIQAGAAHRLEDIYRYTAESWGEEQAELYIRGLFARFEAIAAHDFPWRPITAELGVDGFVCRYERHMIYWKELADGNVGIVTILHERMHNIERLRDDLAR